MYLTFAIKYGLTCLIECQLNHCWLLFLLFLRISDNAQILATWRATMQHDMHNNTQTITKELTKNIKSQFSLFNPFAHREINSLNGSWLVWELLWMADHLIIKIIFIVIKYEWTTFGGSDYLKCHNWPAM